MWQIWGWARSSQMTPGQQLRWACQQAGRHKDRGRRLLQSIFYPLSTVKTQLGPGLTGWAVLIKVCYFPRARKSAQTTPHGCVIAVSHSGLRGKLKLDYLVCTHRFTDFSFQARARRSKSADTCSFRDRPFGSITYKSKNLKQYNWKVCMTLYSLVVYLT